MVQKLQIKYGWKAYKMLYPFMQCFSMCFVDIFDPILKMAQESNLLFDPFFLSRLVGAFTIQPWML